MSIEGAVSTGVSLVSRTAKGVGKTLGYIVLGSLPRPIKDRIEPAIEERIPGYDSRSATVYSGLAEGAGGFTAAITYTNDLSGIIVGGLVAASGLVRAIGQDAHINNRNPTFEELGVTDENIIRRVERQDKIGDRISNRAGSYILEILYSPIGALQSTPEPKTQGA